MNHLKSDIDCSLFNSVLIVGKNINNDRESNGLGKSTIFNAIEYALFNAAPPGLTLDALVNDLSSKCKVQFTFEIKNNIYRITRSKGKKSDVNLEQLVNKKWVNRSAKTSTATDKKIKEIIKINHKTFRYSVLFSQEDKHNLASATPESRRSMLKEPLNLSIYSKYEKLSKEYAKEKRQEIDKLKSDIYALGDPNTDVQVTELTLNSTNDSIKTLNNEINNIRSTIQQKQSLLVTLNKSISNEDSDVLDKLNNIKNNKAKIISNISSLNNSIKDAKSKKEASLAGLRADEKDLKALQSIINSLNNSSDRNEEDIKKDINKASEAEKKGYKYIAKLEAQQSELIDFFLPDSDECPYCKQIITEEHRKECSKKIQENLDKINKEISKYKPKLEKVIKNKSNFEQELNSIIERKHKIERANNQISSKKDDINSKKNIIEQLESLIKDNSVWQNKLKNELKDLEEQEETLDKIANKIYKQQKIAKNAANLKKEITELENDIANKNQIIINKSSLKGSLEEKLKTRQEDKKKLNKFNTSLTAVEKELKIINRAIQAFSSSGIPSMIIGTILDDLQIEANLLLSQLKPELELQFFIEKERADGEQEETLEINYRVHGRERLYKQLSGAQRLVVSLCLKLALSKIIQHRIGVDINFLALDEVDQSLDEAGVDALTDVIKNLQERFTKIFVITHNNSLKYKFPYAIVVEGDINNGVNAKVATSW